MIKVLFFAKVRDQLGTSELQVPYNDEMDLQKLLLILQQRGDIWQRTLTQKSILVAVNQVMTQFEKPLNDGDEVAFFPPVTGG